jgi:hypothetical protein
MNRHFYSGFLSFLNDTRTYKNTHTNRQIHRLTQLSYTKNDSTTLEPLFGGALVAHFSTVVGGGMAISAHLAEVRPLLLLFGGQLFLQFIQPAESPLLSSRTQQRDSLDDHFQGGLFKRSEKIAQRTSRDGVGVHVEKYKLLIN